MSVRILVGDALAQLRTLPDQCVQTCVTSPPYWGLRDYGVAGQIGLERTPDEYVARLVGVFREVRRVLRDDGTLWLNLGDSYAANRTYQVASTKGGPKHAPAQGALGASVVPDGLKPKDLVGIPWMVAFALRADGWYLRSDIIWSKPNPMPESVTDRPTKAHEYLFLFAKGQRVTRVIQFADLAGKRVHLGKYLGADRPDVGPHEVCVVLASAIFDRAQRQECFCLPPFYSQEWKKGADGSDGDFVCGLPPNHVAAVWAARFLDGDATAEEFLHEMDRLRIALRNRRELLVGGVSPESLDAPAFDTDGEGAVTVHHAGKVSKIDFAHKRIIVSAPTTCNYYYAAEAINEPSVIGVGAVRNITPRDKGFGGNRNDGDRFGIVNDGKRNRRSVWTVATQPYSEAHFATFPPKLIEPCILAGSRLGDTVLDPFLGAGTTALVADRLGRDCIGIELNESYAAMARERVRTDAPLFSGDVA